MHSIVRIATVVLLGTLTGLMSPGSARAADDTLDQSPIRTKPDSYFYVGTNSIGNQHAVGQIFTVGLGGYLSRVRVFVENDPISPVIGPILVSIQTVTPDGLPSGREVSSGTMVICSDTGMPVENCVPPAGPAGWVDVPVSRVIVTEGTRYALVLRASGGGGHLRWYDFVGPSAYTGGYMAGNDGSGWWAVTYDDMMFQTYVSTPVLDQSQTATNSYAIVQQNVDLGQWYKTTQIAQVFLTGASGYLHRVRVLLENHSATAPISVSIREAEGRYDGAYPTGLQIGSGTIPVEKIPAEGYPAWVDVTIDDPFLTASNWYAIILSMTGTGWFRWYDYHGDVCAGSEFIWAPDSWFNLNIDYTMGPRDATFETYVLPPITRFLPPPPKTITPCINGVCPAAKGGLTPADYTDGVESHFQFRERPNGTVQGILSFNDSWPDGISLKECSTESAACRLKVTTFACTAQDAILVAGTYTPKGETAHSYKLVLSGVRHGIGTLTLSARGDYDYTVMLDGIVDVTCPIATP